MKRVAAVDIGSNSTRLLITDGTRESIVTRLGEGVDATGRLGEAPMRRVLDVLERYKRLIDGAPAAAVMTSAVRDAANGAEFARRVTDTLGFPARILAGEDEAKLTFAGAIARREEDAPGPGNRHRRWFDRAGDRCSRPGHVPRLHPDRRRPARRAPPALGPTVSRRTRRAARRRHASRAPARGESDCRRRHADPVRGDRPRTGEVRPSADRGPHPDPRAPDGDLRAPLAPAPRRSSGRSADSTPLGHP